jgi:hypothetical protein
MDQLSRCARAAACLLILVMGATAPIYADVNPVGQWKLDEGSGSTTADISGNGNTGTLVGSPAWTTGHTGNALNFNNLTSYVSVNAATKLVARQSG